MIGQQCQPSSLSPFVALGSCCLPPLGTWCCVALRRRNTRRVAVCSPRTPLCDVVGVYGPYGAIWTTTEHQRGQGRLSDFQSDIALGHCTWTKKSLEELGAATAWLVSVSFVALGRAVHTSSGCSRDEPWISGFFHCFFFCALFLSCLIKGPSASSVTGSACGLLLISVVPLPPAVPQTVRVSGVGPRNPPWAPATPGLFDFVAL